MHSKQLVVKGIMQYNMVMISEKAFENKVKIRNNVKIVIQNIEILKLPPLSLKVE